MTIRELAEFIIAKDSVVLEDREQEEVLIEIERDRLRETIERELEGSRFYVKVEVDGD